ncbi:MAG: putative porin [Candidatus Omnitrophica bacterium]|nr:putative porin [Candidatus Omnitrophota bacterium]
MKQNLKDKLVGGILAMLFAFSPVVLADDASGAQTAALVNNLQKQMANMQKTIDAQNGKIRNLESRGPVAAGGASMAEPTPPMSDYEFNQRLESSLGGANKWLKDLSFKGDVRLRYEAFNNTSGRTPSDTDDRNRFRYRLRFGWEKKFSEDLKVGFGLASSEPQGTTSLGDNVSTNSSFDSNFGFKPIFIEKVYASWNPSFLRGGIVKNTNITAGKFDNPFEKGSSDIVWDRDVKPEGVAEKIDFNLLDGENVDLTAYTTFGQFVLDEDGTTGGDSELFAYQGGLNSVFYTPFMERPMEWLGAFSFYNYNDFAQHGNFSNAIASGARGNTNADGNTAELDAGAFKVVEVYNEIGFTPFGLPIRPYYDVATNIGANDPFDNNNLAWALGTKVGGILKKGDWEVSYAYKSIEPDSVVGNFNDSDFGFSGHSGHHGSVFKAGYALMDNVSLNLAAFFVNNLTTGTAGVNDEAQQRFQTDLVWKI